MKTNDSDRQDSDDDWLERLREKHRALGGKRFTIRREDEQDAALRELAEDENGADLRVLELLMALVVTGQEIKPEFQRIANAIVAQSVLLGRLPSKPRGRPKDQENDDSRFIAMDYYDLRDTGVSYSDAVAKLSAKYHKDERHIMRLVKRGAPIVGHTKEDRELRRQLLPHPNDCRPAVLRALEDFKELEREAFEKIMKHDFIGQLDDMIDAELDRKTFPDKKSFGFIASD